MIPLALALLAPEHIIAVSGVTEHDRQDHQGSPEQEELRRRVGGGLPDGDVRRHDIGEQADGKAAVGKQEQQDRERSEEHTSELQSLMRTSYDVFCLKKKNNTKTMK